MFGELVKFTANFLKRGRRVVLHCRRGHRRTGIAIFLVLRYLCRLTHFVKQTDALYIHRKAQGIFTDNSFLLRLEAL